MPSLQPVVLKDRAATPNDVSFQPSNSDGGVAVVKATSGIPIGDKRLTVSLGKTASNRYKPSIKLTIPVTQMETVNGVQTPKVVRTAYAEVNFSFDNTSTEQERNDLVGMLQSALEPGKQLVNNTVVKLEGIW